MFTHTQKPLPSSLTRVESNSRLTIDPNLATFPTVPSLIPPPEVASIAGLNDQTSENEQQNPPQSSLLGVVPPPFMPPSAHAIVSGGRPSGQPRSRYVLPPQLSQSSIPPPPPPVPENLAQPTPSEAEPASSFSSTIILPTPSYLNCSESIQHKPEQPPHVSNPQVAYKPVAAHWFYSTKTVAHGLIWWPFDLIDAQRLEAAAASTNLLFVEATTPNPSNATVPVRGGRYDVLLRDRVYKPVYWPADEEEAGEVRRVTWLYRLQNEQRVLPFSEALCKTLEEHYRRIVENNAWGERFSLPSEDFPHETDIYVFHNEKTMLQYLGDRRRGGLNENPSSHAECAYLHRGLRDDLAAQLPKGDERPIEHVVFVVHGIGSVYNMRCEGLVKCVDDMRKTADALYESHFNDTPRKGRVEFLPVRWHSSLHCEATGINNLLKRVTLRSIPKLRSYTNETLTDILFYTSPKYSQYIVDTVAAGIKHLRQLFLRRNPDFRGDFSIVGHSLGSVIVFDLLSHQRRTPSGTPSPKSTCEGGGLEDEDDWSLLEATAAPPSTNASDLAAQLTSATDLTDAQVCQVLNILNVAGNGNGTASTATHSPGVGLPVVTYPQFGFHFNTCFLLGSPLAIFLVARGVERLPPEFRLSTCQACVNIFHPFDPVAYRLENMIVPDYKPCAVLMPHHKGRKRLHLELKDNIARVGADITARVYQSLRSTWRTLQEFASAHTSGGARSARNEKFESEEESEAIKRVISRLADGVGGGGGGGGGQLSHGADADDDNDDDDNDDSDKDAFPSQLNQGRRLDYVLQEGPLESLNDYLFALSSHAVYWDSQDCLLFILKQIFANATVGIKRVASATTVPSAAFVSTARGYATHHDFTASIAGPNTIQHSASIPVFSNTPDASSTAPLQAVPNLYPPRHTPLFDPSPAPSTVSLHNQDTEDGGSQANAEIADPVRDAATSRFVEVDLAP